MKKLSWVIGIGMIVIIAVITNPKKELHNEVLTNKYFEVMYEDMKNELIDSNSIILLKNQISLFLNENTSYNNYVIFSIYSSKNRSYTIGLFGNAVMLVSKEKIKEIYYKMKKGSVEATNIEKVTTSENWKEQFEIKSIKTGFGATSQNWKPALLINVKNISNNDISEYIEIRAVIYDTVDSKEVGTVTKYIATSDKPFLSKMNKDILMFTKTGYKGSPTSLRLKAKIYIEKEFVKEVEIEPTELY